MNRRIFNIMLCCLLAAVCTGLASCAHEEPATGDGTNPQALYVTFRLAASGVSEGRAASRAGAPNDTEGGSWGDSYVSSEAAGFEERILKGQFHVTFYDAQTGSYAGRLENILCTDYTTSGSDRIYEFHAELRLADASISVEQLRQKTMKMMVVANIPDITDASLTAALSDDNGLGSLKYGYIGQPDDNFTAIPMWGVCTPNLSSITPGFTYDIGTVNLLRAMAKIEVCVDRTNKSLDDVNVKSVTVSRANTSGYGLPGSWNNINETTDLTFAKTLRVPDDVETVQNRVFGKADNNDSVIFYLPECENAAGDEEITMSVTYTVESEEREGTIRLCPYTNGHPDGQSERWNIVRNHHYRYEITGIGVIKFTASVHDWYVVEKEIEM